MTDLTSNDRVALLALWSRLELLRAAGVDTSSLRERVREQLLAVGFDPLAPRPAEAEAVSTADTVAALNELQAKVDAKHAELEAAAGQWETRLTDAVGELPPLDEPLPVAPTDQMDWDSVGGEP